MKKEEQKLINKICESKFKNAMEELKNSSSNLIIKPLRKCSAEVIETENFYLLKSYYTIIAFIEKKTDILFDVLRVVYGYTATSAQHISKFEKDYCKGKWNCSDRYTAR